MGTLDTKVFFSGTRISVIKNKNSPKITLFSLNLFYFVVYTYGLLPLSKELIKLLRRRKQLIQYYLI